MRYSQEALEELSQKINLFEYMGKTVDFVRHIGNTHFAICPFHKEKTASLAVNSDDNYFHCFGCGKSGNIFDWMRWNEGLSFDNSVKKVLELTNSNLEDYLESESMSFYKMLNRLNGKKTDPVTRKILDYQKDYCDKYIDAPPEEWIKEGIDYQELKKYEIRIDENSNRIVYPVYDSEFRMIGVKGRTRFDNYKTLKIMKYMNYNKIGILDYFTGMKQAFDYVDATKELIIVEGIKSVMKIDQWGYHNVVSAETSKINDYQIELMLRMKIRDVVLAFDKDITLANIKKNVYMLSKFVNCYVVIDRWGLLKDKESPCDEGEEVWKTLYERRMRV